MTQPRQDNGTVAAPRLEAIEAGEAILSVGGSAADAAIAASFVLGVCEPYMTGLGAVGEIVACDATGRVDVIDCAGRAPLAAAPDVFDVVGGAGGLYGWPEVRDAANVVGPRAVLAPRLVAGLEALHARGGRLRWAELVAPAVALARAGAEADFFTAAILTHEQATLARDATAAALYYPGGRPVPPPIETEPQRVTNAALADALALVARDGAAPLLAGGVLAADVLDGVGASGLLAEADFEPLGDAVLEDVAPLVSFRGWRVHGSPRPSGAVTAAQILGLLDRLPEPAGAPDDPDRLVAVARASAAAFTDRLDALAGDGDAAALLDAAALDERAAHLPAAPRPPAPPRAGAPTATTHVAVSDGDGAVVSITQTLLSLFGAHLSAPASGFFLNNGMMWFDPRPGRAASIGPRARALSAVSPLVLISEDGERRVGLGALGARRIITAVAQVAQGIVDFGLTPETAVNAPRVHADPHGPVQVDHRLGAGTLEAMRRVGIDAVPSQYGPTTLSFARAFAVETDRSGRRHRRGLDLRAQSIWNLGGRHA